MKLIKKTSEFYYYSHKGKTYKKRRGFGVTFRDVYLDKEEILELLEILFDYDHDLDIVYDKTYGHKYVHRNSEDPVQTISIKERDND